MVNGSKFIGIEVFSSKFSFTGSEYSIKVPTAITSSSYP